jgi:hypothetical protein
MSETLDPDVSTAAAHILLLLDNVQDQLATIRKTAEMMMSQQQQEARDAVDP